MTKPLRPTESIDSQSETSHSVTQRKETMRLARSAFEEIEKRNQAADPVSFAVWYAYCANNNPALNHAVDTSLQTDAHTSAAELLAIHNRFCLPPGIAAEIEVFSDRLVKEIARVSTSLKDMIGATAGSKDNLADASQQLNEAVGLGSLQSAMQTLLHATGIIENQNDALRSQLEATRQGIDGLQNDLRLMRAEGLTDPLTKLANRRNFDEIIQRALPIGAEKHTPFCLLMCDIDHFKQFNDSFGHVVGDQVLRLVGDTLKSLIREEDTAARYGGEEFCVILPETQLNDATNIAERIRNSIASKELVRRSTGELLGKIAISIGVAQSREDDDPEAVIERADRCLYLAKNEGRNRVIPKPLSAWDASQEPIGKVA